jgi:outer membrane protein TolC
LRASLVIFVLAVATALGPVCADAAEGALTLPQLIERARANDLRVKEAEGELRVLRGKYDEAKWVWFPALDATVLFAGPTPESRNDGLGGPPTTESTKMYDLNFGTPGVMMGAEISGFLPLYAFGKVDAIRDIGAQGVLIGEGLRARAQDEAQFQMAQAFYGYQLARQGTAALKDTLTRLDDAGKMLKRMFDNESPQVSQMDLYKVDFFRKQVEAREGAAQGGMTFAAAAVRMIAGAPSVAIEPVDLSEPALELPPIDAFLATAYEHRPELKMINAGIVAREKEVFIRERMFLPDFGVAGFARWKWTTNSTRQVSPFAYDPYNDASAGLALVGRMTFDIPLKQARLEQASAELEKLVTQRDLLRAGIRLEAEKTYSDLVDALSRAKAQSAAERSARRWATAASAAFDLGTGDTRELVDSFTAYATSATEKLRAWHDVQVGLAAMTRVLGAPLGTPPPVPLLPAPAR